MIERLKVFFEKFEDSGFLRRLLLCLIGVVLGVIFVVVAPIFKTGAVTVIFYCFGCLIFLAFPIAAGVDWSENV